MRPTPSKETLEKYERARSWADLDLYGLVARLFVQQLFVEKHEETVLPTPYRSMPCENSQEDRLERRVGDLLYFGTLAAILYGMLFEAWWSVFSLTASVGLLIFAAGVGGRRLKRLLP